MAVGGTEVGVGAGVAVGAGVGEGTKTGRLAGNNRLLSSMVAGAATAKATVHVNITPRAARRIHAALAGIK